MVILLLPLTFVLIRKHGTMGAAWSFAMSVTIGTTVADSLVYRRFEVLISRSTLLKGTIATAILIPLTLRFRPWSLVDPEVSGYHVRLCGLALGFGRTASRGF